MAPSVVERKSSIAYLAFRQANLSLRMDVINMFQIALQFFGKSTKNSNAYISRFLDICTTIECLGILVIQPKRIAKMSDGITTFFQLD